MDRLQLRIQLLTDTTFGRGDGVAGLVDQEVEHDANGFPYLRGRTLKGLLSEECDNLVAVLPAYQSDWADVADNLFGRPGSGLHSIGWMHVGDACLPQDLRVAVAYQIQNNQLTKAEVLDSLTTIRRQTAIDSKTGVADEHSLRSARVVIRQFEFVADLNFEQELTVYMKSLLAVSVLALRHLGSGRHRGRGYVRCTLNDADNDDIAERYVEIFGTEVKSTEKNFS